MKLITSFLLILLVTNFTNGLPASAQKTVRIQFDSNKEILEICKDNFDVFSFNCYDLFPKKDFMDQILEGTGLQMIIGEYHFGTVDRGMAQSLWQVNSQKERGVAYSYYFEISIL